jgi:hypothetical protein
MNESIYTDTREMECKCGHIAPYITKEDNHNGQTDIVNPECSECGKDVRD